MTNQIIAQYGKGHRAEENPNKVKMISKDLLNRCMRRKRSFGYSEVFFGNAKTRFKIRKQIDVRSYWKDTLKCNMLCHNFPRRIIFKISRWK